MLHALSAALTGFASERPTSLAGGRGSGSGSTRAAAVGPGIFGVLVRRAAGRRSCSTVRRRRTYAARWSSNERVSRRIHPSMIALERRLGRLMTLRFIPPVTDEEYDRLEVDVAKVL